jgi:hypothetical protein
MLASYSTGTVSVADGGTSVTGAGGTNWSAVNVNAGDVLQIGEFQTIISDVTDATTLTIPPWGGGVQSGASYNIWKTSIVRVVGGQNALDVNRVLAALNTKGYFVFVGPDETEPDPSLGEEGQFALQPSTGQMWEKTSGVWVSAGTFRGFGLPAPYDNGESYVAFDVVTSDGTSYVCIAPTTGNAPPNASYWVVLAAKGDTGSTGATGPAAWTAPAAWVTATAYTAGPPASVVVQGGETYVCLLAHTSGTFATDLAAGKWIKVAQKGLGDLLSTNNLSDLANGHTALKVTLNGVSFGTPQSLSTSEKAQARSNIFKGPTTQVFTSGSGTYTTPTNCLWIEIEMIGGGGGGAGSGTSPGNGGNGGVTSWSNGVGFLLHSGTAAGGTGASGGSGGTATSNITSLNRTGANGGNGSGLTASIGGFGANSPYGGAGAGGAPGAGNGVAAATNTGSGGGGGGVNATVNGGGGGAAGGFCRAIINGPEATYTYAVGSGGSAGTTGTSGANGGAGGSGFIQVTEHYG